MGASISTSVSKTQNEIITKSVNSCKKGVASNEMFLQGITHDPAPTCQNPTFSVTQSATVDADCFINALQTNMADAISKLNTTAQGGFGITGATNINEAGQKISASLETTCGGVSATQTVTAKDITSRACDMVFVQNANAKSKCKIDALQENAIKTDNALTTDATGASLGSLLFGSGSSIIVYAIAIVIILGGLGTVFYYVRKTDRDDQDGGCGKTTYTQIAVFLAFLALALIIISKYMGWKVPVFDDGDLLKFTRTYNEAQAVADIHDQIDLQTNIGLQTNMAGAGWPSYVAYEKAGGLHDQGKNLFPDHYGPGFDAAKSNESLDDYYKTFY